MRKWWQQILKILEFARAKKKEMIVVAIAIALWFFWGSALLSLYRFKVLSGWVAGGIFTGATAFIAFAVWAAWPFISDWRLDPEEEKIAA